MTRVILKYRWIIIIIALAISIAGALQLPRMETDPDIKNYIPANLESSINTDLIEAEFGSQEMVLLLFKDRNIITTENLSRIKSIDRALRRIAGVESTISLFNTKRIHGEDGIMYVDPAISRVPEFEKDLDQLKSELNDNPLAMGVVVSDDFTMSAIAVSPEDNIGEKALLKSIDSLILEYPGKAEVYFGGLPYIRKAITEDVRKDGLILVPIALLIMLIFLWVSFREIKGVILPFTVVVLSIAIAMGLAPLLGWKLSVLSLLVPIMLIAIANDYGIHMIAKYQELNSRARELNMVSISRDVVRKLRKPILFTGLTTIAGILGLLTHSIIPARHVAVLTSVGIVFAIVFTLFLLPASLSMLKKGKQKHISKRKNGLITKGLSYASSLAVRFPGRIIIISGVLTIIFLLGILRIKVDGNQENFFPAKHPVKQASELINSNFGGSQSISIQYNGDLKSPSDLNMIDSWITEIEECKGVDNAYSISTAIKEMSKSIFDEDEDGWNRIPDTRQGVAQLLELYNMNGEPDDFDRIVDFDYSKAHIIIRFSEPETVNINGVLARVDELASRDKADIIKGGYAYVMSEFSDNIVKGQITSLIFAIIVVFILLSLIFRSLKGGLISSLPILASVVFLLGFMAYLGITLNPATALLSSIMIGVGVDYTIHFLWRYKAELKTNSPEDAVRITLGTTGRGIVINAFSVIAGFSVLMFSGFTSIRFFGYIILISIGVCLISSLLVIPALMLKFRPSFVESGGKIIKLKSLVNKKVMRRAMVSLLLIIASVLALAQDNPDAVDIMRKSNEALKVNSFESRSQLRIIDSKGRERVRENITASKKFKDGTVKRFIKFLAPADIAGTSMLIYDYDEGNDDMWIYLPALKKTRRMVSSDKSKSFMGSDFTNSDMSSPPLKDFEHSIIEELSNKDLWVVESRSKDMDIEDEYGYSKRISYINRDNFTIDKIEFYNLDNELYKVVDISELHPLGDGRFIIKSMSAKNILKNRYSLILLEDIRQGANINNELFVVSSMGR